MTDDRTDQDLLQAHVDGDADAFGELFTRHRDRLWAVALRTMGNPEDAADGLQDGMIAAFRRAGSFRGEAAVTTWLHRVVVNACLDRLRAAKIRRFDSLPDDVEDRGTLVATAQHDDLPDAAASRLAGIATAPWPLDAGVAGVASLLLAAVASIGLTTARREHSRRRLAGRIAVRLAGIAGPSPANVSPSTAKRGPSTPDSA